jgi:hypothetical protein
VRSMVECRALRQKMRCFFYVSGSARNGAVRIDGRAELARFLGVHAAQIGRWLDGSERTTPDRLPSEHLEKLCEEVVVLSGGRLTKEEAWALWADRSAEEFEREIRRQAVPELIELLARKAPELQVRLGLPDDSFGMFEEPFAPLPNDHIIRVGEAFRIEVEVIPKRCLVLIGSTPQGWFWLSPSEWHAGMCEMRKVVVPPKSGFAATTKGPHRLIAFELQRNSAPHVRGRGDPMAMEAFMRQALVEDIINCDPKGWRWGENRFYTENG